MFALEAFERGECGGDPIEAALIHGEQVQRIALLWRDHTQRFSRQ
jgi:hypothetical protein